jgi:hypothetical protein
MIKLSDYVELNMFDHTQYKVIALPILLVIGEREIIGEYRHHLLFDVISSKSELESAGYCTKVKYKGLFPFRFGNYLVSNKTLLCRAEGSDKWIKIDVEWSIK